jgi:hypothetical protein
MKTQNHLDKLLTGAGLLGLGAGFVALGCLSFLNRGPEDPENAAFLNTAYPIIGSLISVLVGAGFFAIAVLFMATLLREKRSAQRRGVELIRQTQHRAQLIRRPCEAAVQDAIS